VACHTFSNEQTFRIGSRKAGEARFLSESNPGRLGKPGSVMVMSKLCNHGVTGPFSLITAKASCPGKLSLGNKCQSLGTGSMVHFVHTPLQLDRGSMN